MEEKREKRENNENNKYYMELQSNIYLSKLYLSKSNFANASF